MFPLTLRFPLTLIFATLKSIILALSHCRALVPKIPERFEEGTTLPVKLGLVLFALLVNWLCILLLTPLRYDISVELTKVPPALILLAPVGIVIVPVKVGVALGALVVDKLVIWLCILPVAPLIHDNAAEVTTVLFARILPLTKRKFVTLKSFIKALRHILPLVPKLPPGLE